MSNGDKYLIATADFDGEIKEFYRDGKKEGFYLHRQYTSQDVKFLTASIERNSHLINPKINRNGYFYSDEFYFCAMYLPDLICEVLKRKMGNKFLACGQGNDFIVYTNEVGYEHARDRYNNHFGGNL